MENFFQTKFLKFWWLISGKVIKNTTFQLPISKVRMPGQNIETWLMNTTIDNLSRCKV